MNNFLDNRDSNELDELYKQPANKKLKIASLVVIGVAIALLLLSTFCIDRLSWTTLMMMRGVAGLSAAAFVVLTGILVYRVNKAYIEKSH